MIESIGFSGGLKPGQLFIQGATFDWHAHCFAELVNGKIIDSTWAHEGVKEREFKDLQHRWIYRIPAAEIMTTSQNIRYEMALHDEIGTPYDTSFFKGFLGIERDWKDNSAWWCSELLGAKAIDVGILKDVPHMMTFTPRDLRRRLEGIRCR